jgi:hypothetical protein
MDRIEKIELFLAIRAGVPHIPAETAGSRVMSCRAET